MRAALLFGSYLLALPNPPSFAFGQETKPEFPSRDELKIIVIHDDQAACSDYPKTFRCPDVKHWVLSVNDIKCADRTHAMAFIKSEAVRNRTPDPKLPNLSELKIKVSAESGAPYSEAESLLAKCAAAGIYKLDVSEKKTGPKDSVITSALGVASGTVGDSHELVVLIGKQEPQEKYLFRWVEAAGLKVAIDDAAKNLGPRDELPIVLKPTPSTTWTEVMQIMKTCRGMGFERVEFAAPFKVSDLPKK